MDFSSLFDEAYGYAIQNGAKLAGPALDIWHDDPEMRRQNMSVEACSSFASPVPPSDRVTVYEPPGVAAAARAVHHGPLETIGDAHQAILRWLEGSGFRLAGPGRDVYLRYEREGNRADSVTEIQYPIEKA